MIGRVVQRGEVEPVVLDLWAIGHVKPHAAEDALHPLPRQCNGVQTALPALAAGQGDIQRFGFKLSLQFSIGQAVAARGQGRFNRLLGQIDGSTARLLLVHTQGSHAFHQLGDAA